MPPPPDPRLQALGSRISRLREQNGLSQEALADACHLSARAIQYIEVGRRDPRYTTLLAIATGLGVPITDLVGPASP